MTLPLYRLRGNGRRQIRARHPTGHAGLWFDKFCDKWAVDGKRWVMKSGNQSEDNPKGKWISTVTNGKVGDGDWIAEFTLRLLRLIRARGGRPTVFTTESRFVTGLGRSHPVENGFAWHSTLGTPFMPGSSVKGMIRSWAIADSDPRPDGATLDRLLGKSGNVGGVCFLDAVPLKPVQLEPDVVTPHYAGWNEEDPPGDWRTPTPIPFLATARDTSFLFGVLQGATTTTADLDTVSGWLRDALAWGGGGAKTAVGYGRFRADHQALEELNRQLLEEGRQHEAMLSPEGRWQLELQGLSEERLLDSVRIQLEKEPIQDSLDRQAFAHAVESTGYVSLWSRGRKKDPQTKVGKKKLRQRARLVREASGDDSN